MLEYSLAICCQRNRLSLNLKLFVTKAVDSNSYIMQMQTTSALFCSCLCKTLSKIQSLDKVMPTGSIKKHIFQM